MSICWDLSSGRTINDTEKCMLSDLLSDSTIVSLWWCCHFGLFSNSHVFSSRPIQWKFKFLFVFSTIQFFIRNHAFSVVAVMVNYFVKRFVAKLCCKVIVENSRQVNFYVDSSHLDKCSFHDQLYEINSIWSPISCVLCQCLENATNQSVTSVCYIKQCPPIEHCHTVR